MASQKTKINPLVDAALKDSVPVLRKRPPGALTMQELAAQTGKSRDWLAVWIRRLGSKVHVANVQEPGMKRYVPMYWLDDDPLEEGEGRCVTCGSKLDIVRPGKWQCPKCG